MDINTDIEHSVWHFAFVDPFYDVRRQVDTNAQIVDELSCENDEAVGVMDYQWICRIVQYSIRFDIGKEQI